MNGIYLMGNYPDEKTFLTCCDIVYDCGYDFIEVGIPFNDPVADGPVIASAAHQVLENGQNTQLILESIGKMAQSKTKYIMTYSNIVFSHGIERFYQQTSKVVDGYILADLPNRMKNKLFEASEMKNRIIPFATLETRDEDIEHINNSHADFVYFIGVRGITGAQSNPFKDEVEEKVKQLKASLDIPVVIGFGIKSMEDVNAALELGDGYIIGTEVVKRQHNPNELKAYLESLKL